MALDDFPIYHPQAQWLIIGWGARHFYTEAATFRDVSLTAWVKGVLGDSSVLRVVPVGPVSAVSDVMWIDLDFAHYTQLIANIRADFADTRAIPNTTCLMVTDFISLRGDLIFLRPAMFGWGNSYERQVSHLAYGHLHRIQSVFLRGGLGCNFAVQHSPNRSA